MSSLYIQREKGSAKMGTDALNRLQSARMAAKEAENVKLLANNTLAFNSDNNDYIAEQICSSGAVGIETILEIGLWRNGYTCPDRIDWFVEGVDFIIVETTSGSFEVERVELQSNKSLAQTKSGGVTHNRSFAILPTYNGRLWQKMLDIQIRDALTGDAGSLYKKYSDGGMHMRISNMTEDGSFGIRSIALNCKVPTWPDVMAIDTVAEDAQFDFEMTIEREEIFEMYGVIPDGFAKPTSAQGITVSYGDITTSGQNVTVSNIVLNDPDLYAYDETIRVNVITETSTQHFDVQSGEDLSFDATGLEGQNITIQVGYFAASDFVYYIEEVDYTVPEVLYFEATGTVLTTNVAATTIDIEYNLTLNDATLTDIVVQVIDGTQTEIYSEPAIVGSNTANATGLTTATTYTARLYNTNTDAIIASEIFTTL